MKPNQSLMKLIIRILILLILLTVLFIVAALLYSVRYWPDLYSYMNPNITITRIPKISEFNVTDFESDVTTEDFASTFTFEYNIPTIETVLDGDEFDYFDLSNRAERAVLIGNDYSDVPAKGGVVSYSFYIDETTTNDILERPNRIIGMNDVEVFAEISEERRIIQNQVQKRCRFNGTHNDMSRSVFPWIATIFIKNGDSQQFEYYCDGVLLSDRVILTAAQCVIQNGTNVDADDIIVVLGKKSLLLMTENEKVMKIKKVIIHLEFKKENNEAAENDVAFVITEDHISFNDVIQPACVMYEEKFEDFIEENLELATTGWAFSGELTAIMFDKEKSKDCDSEAKMDNIFCANYNNDVTVCPSYGGGFVTRAADNVWHLRGLRTGDPAEKGICYNTGVFYTDLIDYVERIKFHLHEFS